MPRKSDIEFVLQQYIERRGIGGFQPLLHFITAEAYELAESGDRRAQQVAEILEQATERMGRARIFRGPGGLRAVPPAGGFRLGTGRKPTRE